MALRHSPYTAHNNLEMYYDFNNPKSYLGEPTSNLYTDPHDITDVILYASNYYIKRTWYPNMRTPLGLTGATLCEEDASAGFYAISRFGGSDIGIHMVSCYVKPLDGCDQIEFGLQSSTTSVFTFSTKSVVLNGTHTNPIFEKHANGWWRIGVNISGRAGGWIGIFGFQTVLYTPTLPYKKFYVCGIQYETSQDHITPFVDGTRSNTECLTNLIPNTDLTTDLSNMTSYNTNGMPNWDVSSYIDINNFVLDGSNNFTIDIWYKFNSFLSNPCIISAGTYATSNAIVCWLSGTNGTVRWWIKDAITGTDVVLDTGDTKDSSTWYNSVVTYNGTKVILYHNGIEIDTNNYVFTGDIVNNTLKLGQSSGSNTKLNGTIGQIKHYTRDLTSLEVNNNYNTLKSIYV